MIENIFSEMEELVEKEWTKISGSRFWELYLLLAEYAKENEMNEVFHERWFKMGINLMEKGVHTIHKNLPTCRNFPEGLYLMGYPRDFQKAWKIQPYLPDEISDIGKKLTHSVINFIDRFFQFIKLPDEEPIYMDATFCYFGSGFLRYRKGYTIVTNFRLIFIGSDEDDAKGHGSRYFLHYPDLQTQAYYGNVDYVYYTNISHIENKFGRIHKYIEITLDDIAYVKSTARHLYGPLFFKMSMKDRVEIQKGELKLTVTIPRDQSNDANKRRQEIIFSKIQNAIKH